VTCTLTAWTWNLRTGKTAKLFQQVVFDEMVIDHVHDYRDLALMTLFNELFELLWR
jgi:hypothetical protein